MPLDVFSVTRCYIPLKAHFQMGTSNEQPDLWFLTELGVKDVNHVIFVPKSLLWMGFFILPRLPSSCLLRSEQNSNETVFKDGAPGLAETSTPLVCAIRWERERGVEAAMGEEVLGKGTESHYFVKRNIGAKCCCKTECLLTSSRK